MSYEQYYMPQQIRRLPFNALRSGLYPQNKPTTDQAFAQYFEDSPGVITTLPARMLYSKWKRPESTGQFAQNGMSFVSATQAHSDITRLGKQYPGREAIFTPRMAAEAINRLPETSPDPVQTPIARGLSNQAVIQPEAMHAYIAAVQTIPGTNVPTLQTQTDLQSSHDWNWSPLGPLHTVYKGARTGGLGATPSDSGEAAERFGQRARLIYGGLGLVGGGLATYHGYRRNRSVGWALVWGLLGSMFPLVTVPIAYAQGFGDRKPRRR